MDLLIKQISLFFVYQQFTIISGKFDSDKVDQDEVFYYKDILHSFLESNDPNITHTKNYIWVFFGVFFFLMILLSILQNLLLKV